MSTSESAIIYIPDIIKRDQNRNGTGVAIYVRNIIPYIERKELVPDALESICIEIKKPKSKPVLIATWYRPRNSNLSCLNILNNSFN